VAVWPQRPPPLSRWPSPRLLDRLWRYYPPGLWTWPHGLQTPQRAYSGVPDAPIAHPAQQDAACPSPSGPRRYSSGWWQRENRLVDWMLIGPSLPTRAGPLVGLCPAAVGPQRPTWPTRPPPSSRRTPDAQSPGPERAPEMPQGPEGPGSKTRTKPPAVAGGKAKTLLFQSFASD
jgi:hypothetical protein